MNLRTTAIPAPLDVAPPTAGDRRIRARLMAVLTAIGLVFAPLVMTSAPAAAQTPAEEAATRAADWLAGQFADGEYLVGYDGSSPDPSNTIDGILALVAAGAHPETVDQATAWVSEQASDFVTDPSSAARVALLAEATGNDPTAFGGVDLIGELQGPLGALDQNPYGLGLLVIALERTGVDIPAEVTAALLATQDADGAFAFPDFGIDIDSTAIAAQGLALLTDDPAAVEAADAAAAWLVANQCSEVSELCPQVGAYWGSYSPANTSGLVIPVLTADGQDATAQTAWLLGQQQADGGFEPGIGAGYSDAYATSQALLGLTDTGLATVQAQAGQGLGTAGIVGIVVALLAIGGGAYFLVRRNQKA